MKELRKFNSFSKEEIKQIAYEYATSIYTLSRSYFSEKYYTQKYVISKILAFSIIKNIVNDEIAYKIMNKACKNAKLHGGETKTRLYYENLFKEREEYQKNEYKNMDINNEISQLISIISSYNDFFFDDEEISSIEKLEDRLNALQSI